MSKLILVRHGNTFNPEETPVRAGARTDIPLVEKGIVQASAIGAALKQSSFRPDVMITGPLLRTQQTAMHIAETAGLSPGLVTIDNRLTEIDYGAWEGKTDQQIIDAGFAAELEAWNKYSVFPSNAGWSPSEAQLISNAREMMSESIGRTIMLVSSNGIIRYYGQAAANADDYPQLKVGTGHICMMECDKKGRWMITEWNQKPEILRQG